MVLLGHGCLEDAARFHRHFPVKNLYVSEDFTVFDGLPLHRGSLLDFLGPSALLTAVPTALTSLTRPGTLAAKMEQPLPGKGDFRLMGGQGYFGPGEVCHFMYAEQTPGSQLSAAHVITKTGWN